MLTPSAIAALADLGFDVCGDPCPLSYIVSDIRAIEWHADDDDIATTRDVIARALDIVFSGGWVPAVG
jgi:hypothetical protein